MRLIRKWHRTFTKLNYKMRQNLSEGMHVLQIKRVEYEGQGLELREELKELLRKSKGTHEQGKRTKGKRK